MDKGRIKISGSVEEVYREGETLKAMGLGLPTYVELSLLIGERVVFDSSSLYSILEKKDD